MDAKSETGVKEEVAEEERDCWLPEIPVKRKGEGSAIGVQLLMRDGCGYDMIIACMILWCGVSQNRSAQKNNEATVRCKYDVLCGSLDMG